MRLNIQTSILLFTLLTMASAANAQVDSTLIRVRATDVDSVQAHFPLYFSSDYSERSNELSLLLASADEYLRAALDVNVEVSLAVLSESAWSQVWPFPYGIPYVSLGKPWTVVMPAVVEVSVLYAPFREVLGAEGAYTMIDNIGFHEVGHVYISEYLYPDDAEGQPPLRWFDEFLAQYLAYSFLREIAPDRATLWDRFTMQTLAQPPPRFTSLIDFDTEYYGFLGGPEGAPNYSWYQSAFSKQAAEVYEAHGLDFLREIKAYLSWDEFGTWTTESVLNELESLSPGFQAWAKGLEK